MSWRAAHAWRLVGAGCVNPESITTPEFSQKLLQGWGGTSTHVAAPTFAVEGRGIPAFEVSDVLGEAVAGPALYAKDVEVGIEVVPRESNGFEECSGHCEREIIV